MRSKKNHLAVGGPEHLALTLLPRSIGREVGSWRNWKTWTWCQFFGHNEWRGNQFIQSARPKGLNHPSYLPVIPMNGKSGIFRNCQVPMISYAWALRICSIRFSVIGCHCWVSQDYRRDSVRAKRRCLPENARRSPDTTASGNCFYYLCNWETNAHEHWAERQQPAAQNETNLSMFQIPSWRCYKILRCGKSNWQAPKAPPII